MTSTSTNAKKPYCDRISAFWDNEKSSPSVVPRLLHMEIDQLCLNCQSTCARTGAAPSGTLSDYHPSGQPAPTSSSSPAVPVYLAIKMPAQRTLRSQQIPPPPQPPSAGTDDADSCRAQERRILVEIQYPHAIKRDNPLLVMLQRRRKYRNLGFKTLGAACINLTDILQMRLLDARLPLLPDFESAQRKQQSWMMKHQQTQPIGYLHVVRLETLPAPVPGTASRLPTAGHSRADDEFLGASDDEDAVADDEEAAAVAAAAAAAAKAKKEAAFGAKPKEWRQKLKLFMDESFSTILKSRKLKPENNYGLELHQEESLWNDLEDIEPPDSSSSLDDDDDISVGSTPKPRVRRYFGSQSSHTRLAQHQQHHLTSPSPTVDQKLLQASMEPTDFLIGADSASTGFDTGPSATAPVPAELLAPPALPDPSSLATAAIRRASQQDLPCSQPAVTAATSASTGGTAVSVSTSSKSQPHPQPQQPPPPPSQLLLSPQQQASQSVLSVTDDQRQHASVRQQQKEQHRHRARSHTASCAALRIPFAAPPLPQAAASAATAAPEKSSPAGRRRSLVTQQELLNPHGSRQVPACMGAPRKECTDAVAKLHGDCLPDKLCLINTSEGGGRALLEALQQQQQSDSPPAAPLACIPTVTAADCRHALAHIASSLGHQTSTSPAASASSIAASSSASSSVYRICIAGSDSHVNSVLRAYVEQFGSKPAAWQSRVRFYYAPLLGPAALGRLLCSADSPDGYGAVWGDCVAGFVASSATAESGAVVGWSAADAAQRIRRYMHEADANLRLPVGEVLLAESADGAQTFVPFVLHVRLGQADRSAESDSELPSTAEEPHHHQQQQQTTPPGSPSMDCGRPVISVESSTAQTSVGEFVDLQLDYWTGGSDRRTALKPALRALRVCQAANGRGLSLSLVNKRQKIMRLGKKGKEPESRRETVEGLTRLICTGKSQPMRGEICVSIYL
uniref:Tau95 domain-containing protein n=1 Tax=Macrostomum lignano TaxID=282301 RepID=A0A1I8JGP1_9PLAT